MVCTPAGSVQIFDDGEFIKFVWTGGDDAGRTDSLLKTNITIQQTNSTDWWIRENNHTIFLKYAEIDSSNPAGPTDLPGLISLIKSWINSPTNNSNPSSNSGSDSFGRTRVATTLNIFNAQFRYDSQPLLFTSLVAGDATVAFTVNESAVTLSTDTGATDSAIYQSKEYMPYQADCTLFVTIGAILRSTAVQANNTARLGYYDDVNNKDGAADIGGCGAFFELDADGTIHTVLRQFSTGSQVDNSIVQSSWNIDKLDGTGSSGITLDVTKAQIYCFEFQMNAGRVRCGVNINGIVYWAHQFMIANYLSIPTLFNYSLPVRGEMFNSGVAVADYMKIYSCSVDLDGSITTIPATPFNYVMHSNLTCPVTLTQSGNHRPLLSIRLKPALCRASIWPKRIEIDNETGVICLWRLILNPTGLTPTWTDVANNSFAQYSTNDQTVTVGANSTILASGMVSTYLSQDVSDLFSTFGVHANISGATPDILTLSVEYIRGAAKARGMIHWQESK